MNSAEIRQKFLEFFKQKGHVIVPSSSLVPEGDSSVLFTTAGMQQFKPYYLGKPSPYGNSVVSIQKCIRTSDIEEVGDERHLTFFEMLGNFCFAGLAEITQDNARPTNYWKEEAIRYAHEFITSPKWMNLKIDYVTVFKGEDGISQDLESEEIWKSIDHNIEIRKSGKTDNFWGPTGEEGPCGPTTEIYVNNIEIWNIVFNQYYKSKEGELEELSQTGVDTGMGLERLAMVSQKVPTVFDTDLFSFAGHPKDKEERIVADHIRAAVMMVADGITPSNSERGYILRRLIRRAVVNSREVGKVAEKAIDQYGEVYDFSSRKNEIMKVILEETHKFAQTLDRGLKEFNWMLGTIENGVHANFELPSSIAFELVTTYGFPFELVEEEAKKRGMTVDKQQFQNRMDEHRITSRAGAEQKFKGGLAGHSEAEVKYHTATHLLHQALHDVLGDEVGQKGSNITPERLRFDFSFPRKLTDEEKQKVEEIVNAKIAEALPVHKTVMPKAEAEKTGARHFFGEKYPDEVSVYYIGDSLENAYSKEFCGGPHVENISELGTFKITKEEAVSAGTRRIKAVLQ